MASQKYIEYWKGQCDLAHKHSIENIWQVIITRNSHDKDWVKMGNYSN